MKHIDTSTLEGKTTLRRLLLAKNLFEHGYKHAEMKGEINKMIAVHNLHNAIEIVLRNIMLHYEIRSEKQLNIEFETMLSEIDKHQHFSSNNIKIPFRQQIRNLNQQRNLVQHHAIEPEQSTIEEWKVFTRKFMYEAFRNYFDKDFNSISQIEFIADERIKKLIELSESLIIKNKNDHALVCQKLAFEYSALEIMKYLPYGRIDGNIFSDIRFSPAYMHSQNHDFKGLIDKLKSTIDKICSRILKSEQLASILSTNISLVELKYFEQITPSCNFSINGNPIVNLGFKEYNSKNAQWGLDFITSMIIHWQLSELNPKVPDDFIECFEIFYNETLKEIQ